MRGGDVAARRVIVRSEMRGDATSARRFEKQRQIRHAVLGEDRLRRLDHELELQCHRCESELRLEFVE